MLAVVATLAKQEAVKRSERTRAGLARVKASGRSLGRPRQLGQHAAQIALLRAQGVPGREIGRRLGISEGSVRRLTVAA